MTNTHSLNWLNPDKNQEEPDHRTLPNFVDWNETEYLSIIGNSWSEAQRVAPVRKHWKSDSNGHTTSLYSLTDLEKHFQSQFDVKLWRPQELIREVVLIVGIISKRDLLIDPYGDVWVTGEEVLKTALKYFLTKI